MGKGTQIEREVKGVHAIHVHEQVCGHANVWFLDGNEVSA